MSFDQIEKELKDIDLEQLKRSDLGKRSFEIVEREISELKGIFDNVIEIAERNPNLPIGLVNAIEAHAKRFIGMIKLVKGYDYGQDENRQFQNHNKITAEIKNFHTAVFSVENNSLLILVSTAKMFDLDGISQTS